MINNFKGNQGEKEVTSTHDGFSRYPRKNYRPGEWNDISKVLRDKTPQSNIFYSAKLSFQYEGEIKAFQNKL